MVINFNVVGGPHIISPRENFLLAVNHEEPYWLPCPLFDGSVITVQHGLVERCEYGLDSWGVRWELRDKRSDSFPVAHPLESPDMVDDYPMPSPYEPNIIRSAVEAASRIDRRNIIVMGDNGWGLFERAWLLLGMNRFFIWAFKYQEALSRLIERICEVKITITEEMIKRVGVDLIWYGDDWGMEDRLLISPEMWRKFIKPYQAKLYWAAKKHGVMVLQHSDGKVEDLIPDLIEIGVNILNIQRECNDWRKIIRTYGKQISLWGGVSARTLDIGSPEKVAEETEECCQLGKLGGIILAPGHSLKYQPEKIDIMYETWLKKGHYKLANHASKK
ncbi:MAG: uroporphyrinogen decarboxylase family protein [Candidatus Bathyarchaeia archaeon]